MPTFNLKGFRTYAVAVLAAILGVSETFDWTQVFQGVPSGVVLMVSSAVFFFLRTITNTPPGQQTQAKAD